MEKKRPVLANRLRLIRGFFGMTQKDVADYLHLERSTYTYYEIGESEPTLYTLDLLATMYGVSIDFLLGRENDNSAEEILSELLGTELSPEEDATHNEETPPKP